MLTHRFDSGWTLNNNLRWQEFSLDGQLVAAGQFRADSLSYRCGIGALNMYRPVYDSPITCPDYPRTDSTNTIRATGVYVRDQIALGERWNAVLGLRHDNSSTDITDNLGDTRQDDGNTSVTVAAFDLERKNVLASDPSNDGYSIAVGKQRTRGAELGFASDLGNGLSLMGGYAYTAAVIIDDGGQTPSSNNTPLNNVPRNRIMPCGAMPSP